MLSRGGEVEGMVWKGWEGGNGGDEGGREIDGEREKR